MLLRYIKINKGVEGHRQRFYSRFLKYPWLFKPIDLLEIILYQALPRVDTRPLAHAILKKYGNIHRALKEIKPGEIKGIGVKTCSYLKIIMILISQLNKTYIKKPNQISIDNIQKLIHHCKMQIYWKKTEVLLCFFLNNKNQILKEKILNQGTENAVFLDIKGIIKDVINYNASTIILCHNHPSGNPSPSSDDIKHTHNLQNSLKAIGVYLWDHIIIGGENYFSFVENGLL